MRPHWSCSLDLGPETCAVLFHVPLAHHNPGVHDGGLEGDEPGIRSHAPWTRGRSTKKLTWTSRSEAEGAFFPCSQDPHKWTRSCPWNRSPPSGENVAAEDFADLCSGRVLSVVFFYVHAQHNTFLITGLPRIRRSRVEWDRVHFHECWNEYDLRKVSMKKLKFFFQSWLWVEKSRPHSSRTCSRASLKVLNAIVSYCSGAKEQSVSSAIWNTCRLNRANTRYG